MNNIIITTSNCKEWNMLPKQNVLRSIDRETDNTGYMARQISVNLATTKHIMPEVSQTSARAHVTSGTTLQSLLRKETRFAAETKNR
jgi:hypothetical protein